MAAERELSPKDWLGSEMKDDIGMGLTLARGSTAAVVCMTTVGSTGLVNPEEPKVVPKDTTGDGSLGEGETRAGGGLGRSPSE